MNYRLWHQGSDRREKVQRGLSSRWLNVFLLSSFYHSQVAKWLFMTELCAYQIELLIAVCVSDSGSLDFTSSNAAHCWGCWLEAHGSIVNTRQEGGKQERREKTHSWHRFLYMLMGLKDKDRKDGMKEGLECCDYSQFNEGWVQFVALLAVWL